MDFPMCSNESLALSKSFLYVTLLVSRGLGDVLDNFLKSTEWFREAINESCQEGSEGGINKNDFLAYMSLGVELVTKSVPIG